MMTSILVAPISSGLISLIFAILLILSSKIFKVDVDRRVSELNLLLPGVNCGSCGFPSCTQFAKALVDDKASVNGCLVGGNRDCSYGCVGFYDCMNACEFDAIIKSKTGVPIIVEDKCVSCNACVKACPQKLIEIHPVALKFHVYCKSKDKGFIAKKNCDRACIGCDICVKNTKEGGIKVDNNLAIINYEDYCITEESILKCPTKAITYEEVNAI